MKESGWLEGYKYRTISKVNTSGFFLNAKAIGDIYVNLNRDGSLGVTGPVYEAVMHGLKKALLADKEIVFTEGDGVTKINKNIVKKVGKGDYFITSRAPVEFYAYWND